MFLEITCKYSPTNATDSVQGALNYFGLDKDDSIIIKKAAGHVRAQFLTDAPSQYSESPSMLH